MQKDNAYQYRKWVPRIPCWIIKRLGILRVLLMFLSFEIYLGNGKFH